MKRLLRLILIASLSLAGPLSAHSEAHADNDSLDIGALLCLTGNCADWGSAALKGAELAAKEINSGGGVLGRRLKLQAEDTRESISGAQAVSAFQKFTALEKFHFIIGPSWSPGALAIAPLAAQKKDLLMLTPSASAQEFNRAGINLFNMRPVESVVTENLARFAIHKGWKRAAVLASSQPAEMAQAQIFRESFVREGRSIVRYIETNPELSDVRTEVLQIVASKPEVVFLIAYNQMTNAANNFRTLGFTGQILTISIDQARVDSSLGALENIVVAKAPPPTPEFSSRFQREYGEPPGLSAENGYDAVLALAKAIIITGSYNPPVVAKALASLHFSGAAGEVAFNADRGVVQIPLLYRVTAGKLIDITPGH